MLQDNLRSLILNYLAYTPTRSQENAINEFLEYLFNSRNDDMLILQGYAGTGKTTLISALVRAMDTIRRKTILMAPTGRAARVFASYSGKPAYTIHRLIYRLKSSLGGAGVFSRRKNPYRDTLFLVDEASMITDTRTNDNMFGQLRLMDDLISFVKEGAGCRLIFIGDTAQLPPVGMDISPALDKNALKLYFNNIRVLTLTDIVRQELDSGILKNATKVRIQITNEDNNNTLRLSDNSYDDIKFINGSDLLTVFDDTYNKYGSEETIVVCRSNKIAGKYNMAIRNNILFYEEELVAGDLLMAVKNNYYWLKDYSGVQFIANGDTLKVLRVQRYAEMHGFRFARVWLHAIDYDVEFECWILLNSLTSDSPSLNLEESRRLYNSVLEDYSDISRKQDIYHKIKEDPFYNALQVKYSYAVTCHKATGGQWKAVFIDQGYITEANMGKNYLRWLYTAITRAKAQVYLVNFPSSLKEEP